MPLKVEFFKHYLLSLVHRCVHPHYKAEPWPVDKPLISVVIPCYNHGMFLSEAVDSILSQTWQNFEIIIVDDGSDDLQTHNILRNFVRPRTRIIRHHTNLGLPAARNTGIQAANGKYICCLDADDKLHPTYLEKALFVLESNYGIGFVYPWTQVFGSESRVWYAPQFDPSKLIYYNQLNPPAVFRRQAWVNVGGFREEMRFGYEDWEFWIRLAYHGYRGYRIPEKLLFYRRVGTESFALAAAKRHNELVSTIHAYNSHIYNSDEWITQVKHLYKNRYIINWLTNMNIKRYYRPFNNPLLIINLKNIMRSTQYMSQIINQIQNHKGDTIIVSLQLLNETIIDTLYTYTPYMYILPHFLPRYTWIQFIMKFMKTTRSIQQIQWI